MFSWGLSVFIWGCFQLWILIDRDSVFSFTLGCVKSAVSRPDNLLRGVHCRCKGRNAEADRYCAQWLRLSMREVGSLDPLAHALSDHTSLMKGRLRQKYAELLAAVAGSYIGEEFCELLPQTPLHEAGVIAE